MLESASFELFFKYVELPNFDIASDAFSTFKVQFHLSLSSNLASTFPHILIETCLVPLTNLSTRCSASFDFEPLCEE